MGGFSSDRGLEILVSKIASIVRNDVPNAKILMVGDGNIRGHLEKIAEKNVIFTGYVQYNNLPNFLSAADVGVILFRPTPNNLLGSPNKLFEYMSAGIPVVESNFPLISQILNEGRCGITVDPTNPKEIADAIIYLLENEKERMLMGENGKRFVNIKYNWNKQEEKLLKSKEKEGN